VVVLGAGVVPEVVGAGVVVDGAGVVALGLAGVPPTPPVVVVVGLLLEPPPHDPRHIATSTRAPILNR